MQSYGLQELKYSAQNRTKRKQVKKHKAIQSALTADAEVVVGVVVVVVGDGGVGDDHDDENRNINHWKYFLKAYNH